MAGRRGGGRRGRGRGRGRGRSIPNERSAEHASPQPSPEHDELPNFAAVGIDLQYLSRADANIVYPFLAANPDERRPRAYTTPALAPVRGYALSHLADMLRILGRWCLRDIIDSNPDTLFNCIERLRQLSFQGAWIDRLEQRLRENIANSLATLQDRIFSEENLVQLSQSTIDRLEWFQEKLRDTDASLEEQSSCGVG